MNLIDGRTGEPVKRGDVVRSIERGDLLEVGDVRRVDLCDEHLAVELTPVAPSFSVPAHYDPELGGFALDGYWLA